MKHNLLIRISAVIFSILIGNVAMSQQQRTLNLKEAINLSIQNSKQLKASKARIDVAIAQVKEAEENRLPNFNVSGSYLRLNSANVDLKSNSNNTSGNGGSSPKISQALYGIANL
jgi:outer membrane protein